MKKVKEYIVDIFIAVFFIIVATWIAASQKNIEIFFVILTLPLSVLAAKYFGDVAGGKAAIEYEKEKERAAQKTALLALLNQTKVAKELSKHNVSIKSPNIRQAQPVVKMPTTSFETAFLMGKESLLAANYYQNSANTVIPDRLDDISQYLSEAYSINTLVDLYISLIRAQSKSEETIRDDAVNRLRERSEMILTILDRLENQLRRDFEAS